MRVKADSDLYCDQKEQEDGAPKGAVAECFRDSAGSKRAQQKRGHNNRKIPHYKSGFPLTASEEPVERRLA